MTGRSVCKLYKKYATYDQASHSHWTRSRSHQTKSCVLFSSSASSLCYSLLFHQQRRTTSSHQDVLWGAAFRVWREVWPSAARLLESPAEDAASATIVMIIAPIERRIIKKMWESKDSLIIRCQDKVPSIIYSILHIYGFLIDCMIKDVQLVLLTLS